jgi:hypothetical protein
MHEIRTQIEIKSTPERVWSILVDFAAHAQWNPFLRSIEGVAKNREKLKVFIQPVGGNGMTFRPTVLVAKPNQELRWLGRFLLPGLFDGEHYFQIAPISPDRVCFIQGEKFRGILVALFKSSLDSGTKAGFVAMNQSLKDRAECDAIP